MCHYDIIMLNNKRKTIKLIRKGLVEGKTKEIMKTFTKDEFKEDNTNEKTYFTINYLICFIWLNA